MPQTPPSALLAEARILLTNAREDAAIQSALAPYGYDAERLGEGQALLEAAEAQTRQQQTEYAEQYAATEALREAAASLRATYVRHVKLARVAFAPKTLAYDKLALRGSRSESVTGLADQADAFYRALEADVEAQQALAGLTVDADAVAAARAQVEAVRQAQAAQARERGEAQQSTRLRDDALATLRGYLADLRAIAAIALEDQPQAREKLGMLER